MRVGDKMIGSHKEFPQICNGCPERTPTMTKPCESKSRGCCIRKPCRDCDDFDFCFGMY